MSAESEYLCPSCGGTFYWNTVKFAGQCWKCLYKLRGPKSFKDVFGSDPPPKGSSLFQDAVRSKAEWVPATESGEAMRYLEGRNVPPSLAGEVGIQWTGSEVACPIRSPFKGRPVTWMRRSIHKSGWYADKIEKQLYWFGSDHKHKPNRPLYLVEGVFDLLSPGLWGKGYALLGSNLSAPLFRHIASKGHNFVILWFDPDYTGRRKAEILRASFESVGILTRVVHGWLDDLRDPGKYNPEEARSMINTAILTKCPTPPKPEKTTYNPDDYKIIDGVQKKLKIRAIGQE